MSVEATEGQYPTDVPGPDEVLKDLSPLLKVVWDALELGAQEAREYFESRGGPIDPYLASHLSRHTAKRYLEHSGSEIADFEIELDALAYSGLRFIYKGKYHVWIRKANNGLLPVPGSSKTMQSFYQQMSFAFIPSAATSGHLVNMMILWDVDSAYALRDELILACPRAGDLTRASVEAHWYTSVPHPAFGVETPHEEIPDDLPIELTDPDPPTSTNPGTKGASDPKGDEDAPHS